MHLPILPYIDNLHREKAMTTCSPPSSAALLATFFLRLVNWRWVHSWIFSFFYCLILAEKFNFCYDFRLCSPSFASFRFVVLVCYNWLVIFSFSFSIFTVEVGKKERYRENQERKTKANVFLWSKTALLLSFSCFCIPGHG